MFWPSNDSPLSSYSYRLDRAEKDQTQLLAVTNLSKIMFISAFIPLTIPDRVYIYIICFHISPSLHFFFSLSRFLSIISSLHPNRVSNYSLPSFRSCPLLLLYIDSRIYLYIFFFNLNFGTADRHSVLVVQN